MKTPSLILSDSHIKVPHLLPWAVGGNWKNKVWTESSSSEFSGLCSKDSSDKKEGLRLELLLLYIERSEGAAAQQWPPLSLGRCSRPLWRPWGRDMSRCWLSWEHIKIFPRGAGGSGQRRGVCEHHWWNCSPCNPRTGQVVENETKWSIFWAFGVQGVLVQNNSILF